MNDNLFLVFSRVQWEKTGYAQFMGITLDELDAADEKGFIKSARGVDCYLSRFLPAQEK
jgi:hypothetical protein